MMLAVVMLVACLSSVMVFAAEGDPVVTFHGADGADGITTLTCTNGAAMPEYPIPVRDGYYFAGWYKEEGLQNIWQALNKVNGDMDLYAKWVQLPGTVVTDNINRQTNITYETSASWASRIPSWFDPNFTCSTANDPYINGDFTLVIDLNNGYDLYGAVISSSAAIKGYRFSGSKNNKDWVELSSQNDEQNTTIDCTFPDGSNYRFIKLETWGHTGWWAHKNIAILGTSNSVYSDIVFMSEGEEFYRESNVLESTAVAGPSTNPTTNSLGQPFMYWCYDEAGTDRWYPTDFLAADTILYAKWLTDGKKVTFVDGDSVLDSYYVQNGDILEQPADPDKPGYAFLGWYADPEYTTPFTFGGAITADTNVYAWLRYSINRDNRIVAVEKVSNFFYQNTRIQDWFWKLDERHDKQVRGENSGENVHVRVTFDQPYTLDEIKVTIMGSMNNVHYTIYGSNYPDLRWNDEEWVTLVDTNQTVETYNYEISDKTAYKYIKVTAWFDDYSWRGFYGIEFFGEAAPLAQSGAIIRDVADNTVSYSSVLTDADAAVNPVKLVALYNGDVLVGVKTVTDAYGSHTFEDTTAATKAKIFVWESLISAKPIAVDEFEIVANIE